jgi:predicted PurR-regulated permease PerM
LEEKNKYSNEEIAIWVILIILFIGFAVMAVHLRGTTDQLEQFQKKQEEQNVQQQTQIDKLSGAVETVRSDMETGFSDQQNQLDQHQEQITSQKNIQSNTIKAFIRYQKQQANQNEEFKEELKND